MAYQFVDHTGDVAVDLNAPDLATLVADAAAALTDTLVDRSTVAATSDRDSAWCRRISSRCSWTG